MSGAAPALEVTDLTKIYRSPVVKANDSISFLARRGEAFGLLGPNGAGKSTLVKQIVGLSRPTSGNIDLFGGSIVAGRTRRTSGSIAYLPQHSLGLDELRVHEAIRFTGMLRGLRGRAASAQAAELIEELALSELVERPMRKLSGGQRRLVHIGMTLIGSLPVLILDEPTSDIDPALRQKVWGLIDRRRREGAAVVLVTHDVAEAERVLDRVAILDGGRVAVDGTPAQLKAGLSHRIRLEVVVSEGARVDLAQVGGDLGGEVHASGRRLSAWVPADEAVRRLEKIMSSSPAGALEDVRLVTPSLEDVYLEVVGRPIEEEGV